MSSTNNNFFIPVDVTNGEGIFIPLKLSLGYASFLTVSLGILFLGTFFVVEGSKNKVNPIISIILALISSILLGFALVITFMWAGIFV